MKDCTLGMRKKSQELQVFVLNNYKDGIITTEIRKLWGEQGWQGKKSQFNSGGVGFELFIRYPHSTVN